MQLHNVVHSMCASIEVLLKRQSGVQTVYHNLIIALLVEVIIVLETQV